MYYETQPTRVLKVESTHFDLVRAAPVAYLLIDKIGQITDANHAALKLLCEDGGELIGNAIFNFLEQAYSRPLSMAIQTIMSSVQARECTVHLFDGRSVRLMIHAVAIRGTLPCHCLVALYESPGSPSSHDRTLELDWQHGEDPDTLPYLRVPMADEEKNTLIDGRLALMHALQARAAEYEPASASSLQDESIADTDAVGHPPHPDSDVRLARLRVLVVTYDSRLATLLADVIEGLDFRCDIAADGVQALKKLRDSIGYDAVIIDSGTRLPIIDGHTLAGMIAEDANLQYVKVMGLTSGALRHEQEASLAAGCHFHHFKVYEPERLAQYVEELADACEMGREAYL